ncbi:RNA-directed DNA polymerase from mobile element jockey [Plakobranchus ocellatus]|uniref:RNA-directed DNA polymerase from mobile element jockey n=1 Tax=Plakobranchus ocellatus TaxID=259542 RepID=A0AAV3YPQ0_9GAST|nr:RNA-directed DNA polymerase from mobile element jockey [Plakobranchus ocellatus]
MPISELNEVFTRAVLHAARRGIPQGVVRKYSPIWTTEFAQAVAKRKQARREYLKSKTNTNRKRYNALCRRVKKIGQVARTKEWRRACENLNPSSDPKIAWQFIRRAKESTGAETDSEQPNIRGRIHGHRTRYRTTEGQARRGAGPVRGNARDVIPLRAKGERHPAQLVQPYVEKRRTATRLAHGGPGTNPEKGQVRDGGRKLPADLAHISDQQHHGAYGERSAV